MQRVSGDSKFLETGHVYEIPIFQHHSLILPGEQFPMIISKRTFDRINFEFTIKDRFIIGLLCPDSFQYSFPNVYGVTCEIFEKGDYNNTHVTIKSRAYQRFKILNPPYVYIIHYFKLTHQQSILFHLNTEIIHFT